jgi:hypothetical protein
MTAPDASQPPAAAQEAAEPVLREVVAALVDLERLAGSPAEEQAARWLAGRMEAPGAREVSVEEEDFRPGYAILLAALSAVGAVAGAAAASGRARRPAAAAALSAAAAIADDVANGPRLARRALAPRRTTWNVVGEAGDPGATRLLVVLAHHDAAPAGFIFHPGPGEWVGRRFPHVLDRANTSVPLWWPVILGPALAGLGALSGRRGLAAAGALNCALAVLILGDVARDRIVPGANDNLSGVAALVALAGSLRAEPVPGVRVLLASCGAEEVLQGGIYGFAARHLVRRDPEATWVLNLDTVGSPRLAMLEGEGTLWMEEYPDPPFRDVVARAAEARGVPLLRGLRARTSTDAVVPARLGLPTATLISVNAFKALSNYHQPTDTLDRLDLRTVGRAVAVAEAVARALAVPPGK